ncbi:hypothetical protein EMIHUDRAFT_119969 [Emiliania huxleyi CCMP1516]|uniref:Uncharacterized protein n=2 Tax=Emiliania huxleyi TaxID=2903 RepID=A0A0D3IP57_EMIH1|nr:hypothetical protein EMIHUDRAFT_119969 [Emiliania huxleyi CCMP1516]EOD13042.1 hypothetical protein EMIHUDRAFT_119969 [Emiliania huxleyi CCMP1516]|eukprot:XP_005765471.1 hypothetical protein EMIHUDRAFT_119969 [Emiliania huxleyi CCMP1516]
MLRDPPSLGGVRVGSVSDATLLSSLLNASSLEDEPDTVRWRGDPCIILPHALWRPSVEPLLRCIYSPDATEYFALGVAHCALYFDVGGPFFATFYRKVASRRSLLCRSAPPVGASGGGSRGGGGGSGAGAASADVDSDEFLFSPLHDAEVWRTIHEAALAAAQSEAAMAAAAEAAAAEAAVEGAAVEGAEPQGGSGVRCEAASSLAGAAADVAEGSSSAGGGTGGGAGAGASAGPSAGPSGAGREGDLAKKRRRLI